MDHIPDSLIEDHQLGGNAEETIDDLMNIVKKLLEHIHQATDENPDGEASTSEEDID
jgi:hypothetical protein